MISVSKVTVLSGNIGAEISQLCVNKSAGKRDQTAENPCAQYEERSMNLPGHDVRVHKYSRSDDAAHDDHRRVKWTQAAREFCVTFRRHRRFRILLEVRRTAHIQKIVQEIG